jgi:uncharacterized protein YaeQ
MLRLRHRPSTPRDAPRVSGRGTLSSIVRPFVSTRSPLFAVALKSTIFKAHLQVADIDHGYYADHALTLARHPSETDERMMARLAALALNAHQLTTMCNGDATLAFGAGLSDPDDPDISLVDFTGRKRLWVEVGQPEDKPLSKACSQADTVMVYAYGHAAEIWWRGIENKLSRLDRLQVWRLPHEAMPSLIAMAERSMQLQATVQDGALTLSSTQGSVHLEPQRWK